MAYDAALWDHRKRVLSRVPLVAADPAAAGDYLDADSGWGNDIYYKGSWVAHTLRLTIGDAAFREALRRLVYGRPNPAPGNFAPVRRTTADFSAIVSDVAGRPMDWFFDAYIRQAPLPRLVEERRGSRLHLRWETDGALPFAMPVEVRVGDRLLVAPMADGTGMLELGAADTRYVIDPEAKILRDDPAITAWQAQEKEAAASPAD